uniref:TGF-beta family profile domain-containing protein n=1 Tax=Salarias fasciatus TaxID=181472 RepID=A0A672IZ96_SALFA
MAVFALCSLLLSWSRLCVALQVPDRQTHGPIVTDCVHFRRNPVRPTNRKTARGQSSTEIEDFCRGNNPCLQTSFLCELKRFLGVILPQESSQSPLVQLDSLRSLPPLMLGLSSSETLLAGMINSSAPTVFSFNSWGSTFPVHQEQLALSPPLLEELRQRLEEIVPEIMEMIKEEKLTDKATERLRRLQRLSVWKETELAAGEQQYCAFLLLKALQTVAHAYDLQRRLRATRAQPSNPVMGNVCGLRSLTVSFERVLVGPNTANINNCHGSCAFPLTNANNHAVQLNYHIESGHTDERAPCCVPVAYEGLEVMELDQHGTYISTKPDVIAKECGCR